MAGLFADASGLVILYVFADDFSTSRSRALLDWCVARGADTFTVNVVGVVPAVEPYGRLLDERLARYAVPAREFPPIPEGPPGGHWTRPQQLWSLDSESAKILWSELAGGLLSCCYDNAWLEDPVLYRGLKIMLGVVSHEREGVLRIRPEERRLLDEADIPYRLHGEWVG